MRIFKIDDEWSVVCDWRKTRIAFKHVAQVCRFGKEFYPEVKICYQNRTWECYEYQDVLHKAVDEVWGKWLKLPTRAKEIKLKLDKEA